MNYIKYLFLILILTVPTVIYADNQSAVGWLRNATKGLLRLPTISDSVQIGGTATSSPSFFEVKTSRSTTNGGLGIYLEAQGGTNGSLTGSPGNGGNITFKAGSGGTNTFLSSGGGGGTLDLFGGDNGTICDSGCVASGGVRIAPGYTHSGSPQTVQIFGQGGDIVRFRTDDGITASTTLDVINSLGYLGIGTTSPYAPLSVAGTGVLQNVVATSTTASSTFYIISSLADIINWPAKANILASGPSEDVQITTGSATSTDRDGGTHEITLGDGYGTSNGGAYNLFGGTGGSLGGSGSDLSLFAGQGGGAGGRGGNISFRPGLGATGSTNGVFQVYYPDTTNPLFIIASSSVGIGTSTPYAKLSVVGPVVAEYFHATSTIATSTFAGGIVGANNFVVQQNSGWVGIASSSPRAPLSVVGSGSGLTNSVLVSNGTLTTLSLNQRGQLLLGSSTPDTSFNDLLQVVGVGTRAGGMIRQYSNTATTGGFLQLSRARGTDTSASATVSGDRLGILQFSGYHGSGFGTSVNIRAVQDGAISGTNVPGMLIFDLAGTNGSGAASAKAQVNGDGRWSILHTATSSLFSINGSAYPSIPAFGVGDAGAYNNYFTVQGLDNSGFVGVATTSPWKTLGVSGDLSLTGGFYDSLASAGTNGYVLQSTGSATKWVATSTLGLSGGGGTVTSVATNNGLTGGTITTSGTIGLNVTGLSPRALVTWDGSNLVATGTPQLTVGNLVSTTTSFSSFVGSVGFGTTSPRAAAHIQTSNSGANPAFIVSNGNLDLLTENADGQLILGSTTATTKVGNEMLYIGGNGTVTGMLMRGAGSTATLAPRFLSQYSRGTIVAPTATQSADRGFFMQGYGYTGSAYTPMGSQRLVQDGAAGTGTGGTWIWSTSAKGGTSASVTDRMQLDGYGTLAIGNGNTSFANLVSISGDASTTIPSLGIGTSGANYREYFVVASQGNGGYVGIGTTTPATRLHISNGGSATTTATLGELGDTTSTGCINMNRVNGSPGSFYINSAGTGFVVEPNYCR